MSVYHMWTLCPWRLEEGAGPSESGIMETVNYTGIEPRSSARTASALSMIPSLGGIYLYVFF